MPLGYKKYFIVLKYEKIEKMVSAKASNSYITYRAVMAQQSKIWVTDQKVKVSSPSTAKLPLLYILYVQGP